MRQSNVRKAKKLDKAYISYYNKVIFYNLGDRK